MASLSLFERLSRVNKARPTSLSEEYGDIEVAESILSNLRAILNSRQGCCETRLDYGITDFNAHANHFRALTPTIARDVETQIRKFEPRLSDVSVRAIPSEDSVVDLSFHMEAVMNLKQGKKKLSFNSTLRDNGYIRIY